MSDIVLSFVQDAIVALVNESRTASDNQDAIGKLGTFAKDSIKPQVDAMSRVLQDKNEGNDNVTQALSVLLIALENAKDIIQKRGVKRPLRRLPVDDEP